MARNFREQDHTGMPSRARLAEEVAPVAHILGGEPEYVDRQIRRDMSAEIQFDEVAFAEAKKIIESSGWRYVITERRGRTTQYKYCRGRLAFTFELVEEKSMSYGVTWESQPRAFAYCKRPYGAMTAVRRNE